MDSELAIPSFGFLVLLALSLTLVVLVLLALSLTLVVLAFLHATRP